MKFITDRGNATRAEIETYYRNGIRGLIAGIVDEEFNKIRFFIENLMSSSYRSYNGVLTRNPQTGQYTLSYEGFFNGNEQTKTLTATSLEALLLKMRNDNEYKNDFSQTSRDTVSAQAALIPAVVYERNNNTALTSLKNILTDFYVSPTCDNYERLVGSYNVYRVTRGDRALEYMYASLRNTLTSLNPALAEKIAREAR